MTAMQPNALELFLAKSSTDTAIEDTIDYLKEQLAQVLKQNETVLICFPRTNPKSFGAILDAAVTRCGGRPIFWEEDLRWRELLRLAFLSRASTIIGTPLTVMGLSKLASYQSTPLSIVNAITVGYPCLDWMLDGIISGLDCKVWGIMSPKLSCSVAGFSCECGRGIHVREDVYGVSLVPETVRDIPGGKWGKLQIFFKDEPEACAQINTYAMLSDEPCPCGRKSKKLTHLTYGDPEKASKFQIMEDLLYWNSILDCRVEKTEYGLELEVVCFPGLKLPKFPSCARMMLRQWNPAEDVPFEIALNWK